MVVVVVVGVEGDFGCNADGQTCLVPAHSKVKEHLIQEQLLHYYHAIR